MQEALKQFRKSEKEVEKIVIVNKDGTTEEIQKGFVGIWLDDGDEGEITIRFANMGGPEVIKTFEGLVLTAANVLPSDYFDEEDEEV